LTYISSFLYKKNYFESSFNYFFEAAKSKEKKTKNLVLFSSLAFLLPHVVENVGCKMNHLMVVVVLLKKFKLKTF
jgi:hypothetical protein